MKPRGAAPAVQPQDSATAQGGQSDDSCKYANDGVCDDDDPGLCAPGTDATDCASRRGEKVAEAQAADNQPDDSCQHANDGECDNPGLCAPGTDATDCASRRGEEVAEAQNAEEDPLAALRGTPPPTGTKMEKELRELYEWGGQLDDVNAKVEVFWGWENNSLLLVAARINDMEAARWLVANGAEVNAKIKWGATPLHGAAYENAAEVAELLIANGAEVNAKDEKGRTPMDAAIAHKSHAMQSLLRRHGGRCNKRC